MDFELIKNNVKYLSMDIVALDVLLQFEKILDESGVYVYKNWEEGEVIEGPLIERHWVEVKLMYPKELMPEPVGALRLVNIGSRVFFSKATFLSPVRIKTSWQYGEGLKNATKNKKQPVWIVTIRIPRRLITQEIKDYLNLDYTYKEKLESIESMYGHVSDINSIDNTGSIDDI